MRKLPNRLKPFLLFLTLGMGACGISGIFSSENPQGRLFSHRLHVQDQQLECLACHAKAEKEDKAGMPASLKKCMTCHEGEDESKPPERKLKALLGEKPEWSKVTEIPAEVRFSHKRHVVDAKVGCAECHEGIEKSAGITADVRVEMEDCMDCHASKGASNDCSTCHSETRTDTPPPNHRLNWKQNHGPVMRSADDTRYENRCSLCHTQEHCSSCHQDEAPRSHTNFWRLTGHGTAAGVDRSACVTCHRPDFCDRCHHETTPRSHTASWGGPRHNHCMNCHVPAAANTSCRLCHDDLSHRGAPPRPSDVQHAGVPASECRSCHTVVEMRHADNRDSCTACH